MVQMQPVNVKRRSLQNQRRPLALVRNGVEKLLRKCQAFRSLSPAKQQAIAHAMVDIVDYLALPEDIPGNLAAAARKEQSSSEPYALELAQQGGEGTGDFTAVGAREGAKVAGLLLQEVNFPDFVTGLIDGVFSSIVTSSIKQMEAYGQLVADVAKTLNDFRDENVTDNQGRDHLVEQFPDLFQIDVDTGEDGSERPRVRLQSGVDEAEALDRVNNRLPTEGAPLDNLDLEDDETEQRLVKASRTQLASSRQQLLATMVLMGINRINVTSGRIAAKVNYRFQATDRYQSSATKFDYQRLGTRYTTRWSKGNYKFTQQPDVKIKSIGAETTDANLQAAAQLAGEVNVNFKSETLPLEKMADSFQISEIQQASRRNRPEAEPAT